MNKVGNGVSGLISRWGKELGHSLEVQQGSQTSLSVATGNSEFHSRHCHGISPYVKLRGNTMSFQLTAGTSRFISSFNRCEKAALLVYVEHQDSSPIQK